MRLGLNADTEAVIDPANLRLASWRDRSQQITFKEYKEFSGVYLPIRVIRTSRFEKREWSLITAEVNPTLPANLFKAPRTAQVSDFRRDKGKVHIEGR